jgi:hypothetical protein
MRRGDLLLRWVSCFAEIRIARVQAAAERLCAPPVHLNRGDPCLAPYLRAARKLTRNLVRIGHVEEVSKTHFRTVPPTIVSLGDGRHLLFGARHDELRAAYAATAGITVTPAAAQQDAPAVWQLVGSEEAVAMASAKIGVNFCRDRWGEVMASLPALQDGLAGAPAEAIPRSVELWNPRAIRFGVLWRRTTSSVDTGIYRTVSKPHQYYLRPSEAAASVRLDTVERRVAAAWRLVSSETRICYHPSEKTLAISALGFALPLLIDRALIIPSGRVPVWKSRDWIYHDIDPVRAHHVARILGSKLKVTK